MSLRPNRLRRSDDLFSGQRAHVWRTLMSSAFTAPSPKNATSRMRQDFPHSRRAGPGQTLPHRLKANRSRISRKPKARAEQGAKPSPAEGRRPRCATRKPQHRCKRDVLPRWAGNATRCAIGASCRFGKIPAHAADRTPYRTPILARAASRQRRGRL